MTVKPFVSKIGQGPDLMLIHGWGIHGEIWENILPMLAQSYTVHNVDLPGFGRSPVHNGVYDIDYLTDSVASVMPQKAHIVGWSLGGLVATAIALKYPHRVNKLVTVASTPLFVTKDDWSAGMKPEILDSFIDYLQEDYESTVIRFLGIQTMGSATQKDDIKKLKNLVFLHGQPSRKALQGGLQILKNVDLRNELKRLASPLLRLYGRRDTLVVEKVDSLVRELLPSSQSKVYRNSAHAPFLSEGERFTQDVRDFLSRQE